MPLIALLLAVTLNPPLLPTELGPADHGPVISFAAQFLPHEIAAGPDTFLSVWQQPGPLGRAWYASLLDEDGKPLTPVPFALGRTSLRAGGRTSVAAADHGYGLIRQNEEGLAFGFLKTSDPSAETLEFKPLPLEGVTAEAFAWNSGRFLLIVRSLASEWTALLLDRDGSLLRTIPLHWAEMLPLTLPPGAPRYLPPAVVAAGDTFVLVFPGEHLDRGLHVQRISLDGELGARIRVADHTGWLAAGSANGDVALASGEAVILLKRDGRVEQRSISTGAMNTVSAFEAHGDGYLLVSRERHGDQTLALQMDHGLEVTRSTPGSLARIRYSSDARLAIGGSRIVLLHRYFETTGPQLSAYAFDLELRQLGSNLLSLLPNHQSSPRFVSDGAGAVAVWQDRNEWKSRLLAVSLDREGKPGGPVVTLWETWPQALGPHALATNGMDHLVTWRDHDRILFVRLSANGTRIDQWPHVLATGASAEGTLVASWTGSSWFVIYGSSAGAVGAILTAGGTVVSEEPLHAVPDVLTSSSQNLLAFQRESDPGDSAATRLVALPYGDSGKPSNGSKVALPRCASPRGSQRSFFQPAAASDGTNFLAVCSTQDGTLAHLIEADPQGIRVIETTQLFFWPQVSVFSIARDWSEKGVVDVVWDGSHYLVSHRYETFAGQKVALIRVDKQGRVVSREVVALAERAAETVRPIARPGSLTLLTTSERGVIARATTYVARNTAPLPSPPPPPANVRLAHLWNGFELEWEAEANAQEGFVLQQRRSSSTGWETVATAGDVRRITLVGPAFERPDTEHLRLIAVGEGGGSHPVTPSVPARRRSVGR